MHFPNSTVPIAEVMAAIEEMKVKGKLLSIGVSDFSLRQMKDANAALKKSQLASNRVDYSLANREIEADPLRYCESNKTPIVCYYPLVHGKLTGAGPRVKMEAICNAHSKTPAQVALNWLVAGRNVFAIPRASRAKHVRDSLGASGWKLKQEDRAQLDAAFPR